MNGLVSGKRIERDVVKQPIIPSCILANKSGKKLGVLIIDEKTLTVKVSLEDSYILLAEMSCDVHKYINTVKNPLWDQIKDFKLLYIPINVPHIKSRGLWFEITVTIDDFNDTVKHLTGTLAQYAELNQSRNYDVEIRTEDDIDRDDYEDTVFYNPLNPDASIVDRILHDKARHYTIYHVDDSLKNVKRTFDFDKTEVIDCFKELAEEVDCIVILGESDEEADELFQRTISFYDAKDYCPECGKRGDFSDGCTNPKCTHSLKIIPRYGKDTGIFINRENLGDNINLSTNTDNIKNCYRLSAGDDDMTAAIVNCNPSGSRYIWRFTDNTKEDMSDKLRNRLDMYEKEYEMYRHNRVMNLVSSSNIDNYNNLVDKYQQYSEEELMYSPTPIVGYTDLTALYYHATYLDGFLRNIMMPYSSDVVDTTAEEQLNLFTDTKIGVRQLSAITQSTATIEIRDAIRVAIDTSRYDAKAEVVSYAAPVWQGTITVTSLTDEEDTAFKNVSITLSEATDDYIKTQIEKIIKKKETLLSGIVNLLKASSEDFENEMVKYNLVSLTNISSTINSVLNILDEAKITETTHPDAYENIYKPYLEKRAIVEREIQVRENDLEALNKFINDIETQQEQVNKYLDLESYLGNSLWLELLAFRREDEQENTNFVSDGLSIIELIQNAQDFFDRADEDIAKRAESQYSISCTLRNLLLLLPETIDNIDELFDVGNWLRIEVDDKIYKLRLISYQINYGALNTIEVEFNDVKAPNDFFSSYKSMRKSTHNNEKTLTDLSKKIDDTENTANIVNQISSITQGAQGNFVATISADNIMITDDKTLQDYVLDIIGETNGSLTITLTNEFQAVFTDEDGQGGDYSDCYTDAIIYYDGIDITNSAGIQWNIIIPESATAVWDNVNHRISVSNIINNYATIEIHAIYRGTEVRKSFVVKKLIAASSPIIVEIESSAGNIFKNRGINTLLTATVRRGNTDISDKVTKFHWVKYDKDGNEDTSWSRLDTRTIQISPADLFSKAIFKCEVSFD